MERLEKRAEKAAAKAEKAEEKAAARAERAQRKARRDLDGLDGLADPSM